jgi:hypothetical protein
MIRCAAAALCLGGVGQLQAGSLVGYGTGPNPWSSTNNQAAMNTVFGNGNWNQFDFSTAPGAAALDAALTSGNYRMIFLDGGDGATDNFDNFVNTYRGDLQSFVSGGGSLILNAARWPDSDPLSQSLNLGFGVTLNNNDYAHASATGTAVDPSNALFQNNGFGSPGTSWTGNDFSHDYLTGNVGTVLITGGDGSTVLSEENYGNGFVMFGGITDPGFQGPGNAPYALRDNMLYVAGNFAPPVSTPEPASLVSLGLGALGLAGYARRRKLAVAPAAA